MKPEFGALVRKIIFYEEACDTIYHRHTCRGTECARAVEQSPVPAATTTDPRSLSVVWSLSFAASNFGGAHEL